MSIDKCIEAAKEYFPDPLWKVWATESGLLSSFQTIGIKGTIGGKLYGLALQYSGRRATAWEWGWDWEPADWSDLEEWPDDPGPPPAYDGTDGERVRGEWTATRCWDWVWKKRGTHFEDFEVSPDTIRQMAKCTAKEMRDSGVEW